MSSIIPRFTGRLSLRLRAVRSTMAFASCPMARNSGLEASPEKAHRVGSLKTMPLCCSKIMVLADPKSIAISALDRSEEHTSELQSLMRISYAVFCLKKKKHIKHQSKHKQINILQ